MYHVSSRTGGNKLRFSRGPRDAPTPLSLLASAADSPDGLNLPVVWHDPSVYPVVLHVAHPSHDVSSSCCLLQLSSSSENWTCEHKACLTRGAPQLGAEQRYCCCHTHDLCIDCAFALLPASLAAVSAAGRPVGMVLLYDDAGRETVTVAEAAAASFVAPARKTRGSGLVYPFLLESLCKVFVGVGSESVRVSSFACLLCLRVCCVCCPVWLRSCLPLDLSCLSSCLLSSMC